MLSGLKAKGGRVGATAAQTEVCFIAQQKTEGLSGNQILVIVLWTIRGTSMKTVSTTTKEMLQMIAV